MSEKPTVFERRRWWMTAGAALEVWAAALHTARHEVGGYPWPPVLTLPILWLSALCLCFLAGAGWVAWDFRRRGGFGGPRGRAER